MKIHYEPPGTPEDEHIDMSLDELYYEYEVGGRYPGLGLYLLDCQACENLEPGCETILSNGARVLRYDGTTMDPDSETYYRKGERET